MLSETDRRVVIDLRNNNPMWAKRKIAVVLRWEGVAFSIAMVGRQARRSSRPNPAS